MSAIGGIFNLSGMGVDPAELGALSSALAVRGPDGAREWIGEGIGLTHLAFHITPESAREQQPLVRHDGRLVLVADARLDNRDELIARLGGETAVDAAVATDADLLLAGFQRWGTGCVRHLLGDFVFAVWNGERRELFLARDPLGARSLSVYRDGRRVVFASETGAILRLPGVDGALDPDTVLRAIGYVTPDEERTFFRDVRYLPPAHAALISPAGQRWWRYWQLDPGRRITYADEGEYVDHFLDLLRQATAARLRGTAPVGISLSGGNDSTLLAACAAEQLPGINPSHPRLKSFSYVFDRHPACDERQYIEPVVARYRLDAHFIPSDDAWSFRDLETGPVDRDFLWTNCYAQLPRRAAQAAQAAGCRLLLDGNFGDALFSGRSFYAADLLSRRQWSTLWETLRLEPSLAQRWQALVTHGLRLLIPPRMRHVYRRIRPATHAGPPLIADPGRMDALHRESTRQDAARCGGIAAARQPRCRGLLDPSWANGMAAVRGFLYARHGLEKVSPYFDRRLVEFILAIPQEQVARPGAPRRLQRLAMRRLLPDAVWQRRTKTSYESLLREGMLERERGRIAEVLRNPRCVRDGWVDGEWLQAQMGQASPENRDLYMLSTCINFERWLAAREDAP